MPKKVSILTLEDVDSDAELVATARYSVYFSDRLPDGRSCRGMHERGRRRLHFEIQPDKASHRNAECLEESRDAAGSGSS